MKKLLIFFLLLSVNAYAAPPQRIYPYIDGTTIRSDEVTGNEDEIFGYLQTGVDTLRTDAVDAITEIKSTIKSGSDATLITGTATAGMCGQFDSNGDLVSAGAACGTGSGSSSTGNTKYNNIVDPDANGGITFGSFTNSWTTSAGNATFFTIDGSGTDFVVQGDGDTTVADLTVGGDDIIMATNTSGAVLVADGTNFNPVVMGTDATISSAGALTIAANAVALGTDTTGNYADGDGEAGNVAADKVIEASLKAVDAAADEDIFTYESTTGDFEWHTGAELCTAITGSAGLCDGSDDGGVGSTTTYDSILNPTKVSGIHFSTFANSWTSSATTGDFFSIDSTAVTTGDTLNINIASSNSTGDAIEINRAGSKVAGINGFGQLNVGSFGGATSGNSGITFGAFTNTWTVTNADTAFFTIDATADFVVRADGNVGIGNTDPSTALVVTGTATATTSVSTPLLDLSGTGTINGLDAIDSTGETTLETTLDLAGDVSSTGLSNTIIGSKAIRYDEVGDPGTAVGFNFAANTNIWTATGSSAFFTINGSGEDITILANGNLGIGDATPAASLSVGNGDDFQVTSAGNITYGGTTTTLAASQTHSMAAFTNTWTSTASSGLIFEINDSDEGMLMRINEDATVEIGESTDASYSSFKKGYTADPCGSLPDRAIFYNETSAYPCYCTVAGVDLKFDGSTACF